MKKPSGKKKGKPSKEQLSMEKYNALRHEAATNPKKEWSWEDEEWMIDTVKFLEPMLKNGIKIKISRNATTERIRGKDGKMKNQVTRHTWDCSCVGCEFSLESIALKEREASGDSQFPPGKEKQTKISRSWRLDGIVEIQVDKKGKPVLDYEGYPRVASGGIRLAESQWQKRIHITVGREITLIKSHYEYLSEKCFNICTCGHEVSKHQLSKSCTDCTCRKFANKPEKFGPADFAKYALLTMNLESVLGRFVARSGPSQNNTAIEYADLLSYVRKHLDGLKKMKKEQEKKTELGKKKMSGTVFDLALRAVADKFFCDEESCRNILRSSF